MAKKVKVKLNREGVRAMLRSQEMQDICQGYAQSAAASLGSGYTVSTYVGKNRVNAEIAAETEAARADNLKNNSILKALKGGTA